MRLRTRGLVRTPDAHDTYTNHSNYLALSMAALLHWSRCDAHRSAATREIGTDQPRLTALTMTVAEGRPMRAIALPHLPAPDYPRRRPTLKRTAMGTWALGSHPSLSVTPERPLGAGLESRHVEVKGLS